MAATRCLRRYVARREATARARPGALRACTRWRRCAQVMRVFWPYVPAAPMRDAVYRAAMPHRAGGERSLIWFWYGRLDVRGLAAHVLAMMRRSSERSTWCGDRRPRCAGVRVARATTRQLARAWRRMSSHPWWPALADAGPAWVVLAGDSRRGGKWLRSPRCVRERVRWWSAGRAPGSAAAAARARNKVPLPWHARRRRGSLAPKPAGARQVDARRLQSAASTAPSNEPTVERKVSA